MQECGVVVLVRDNNVRGFDLSAPASTPPSESDLEAGKQGSGDSHIILFSEILLLHKADVSWGGFSSERSLVWLTLRMNLKVVICGNIHGAHCSLPHTLLEEDAIVRSVAPSQRTTQIVLSHTLPKERPGV